MAKFFERLHLRCIARAAWEKATIEERFKLVDRHQTRRDPADVKMMVEAGDEVELYYESSHKDDTG